MKKLMFLLPVAALAMASCSSSEDVAQNVQTPSQELKFFTAVQGNTRGAIETTASISKFYVYADGQLKKTAVATTGDAYSAEWQKVTKEGTVWTPQTKMWWATDQENENKVAEAKFTAFANALSAPDTEMESATNGKLVDVIVPDDVDKQKDLVVAYNAGKRTDFISGVPLHFRHVLSQIVVNATYANDADFISTKPELVVKVKGIQFVGLKNKGTLTLPTASTAAGSTYEPVWASVSGSTTFASAAATDLTLANAAQYIDDSESGNPLLLMPQQTTATTSLEKAKLDGAYLMVQVDIDYKETQGTGEGAKKNVYPKRSAAGDDESAENNYAWIAVPVSIDWKGGYKYTYTLNFSNIAAGKVAPGTTSAETGQAVGDPVISGVRTPVNFLVTVEEAWIDGGSFTPAM